MQWMLPLLDMEEAAPPESSSSSSSKQVMRTVSISILVMSLPALYVSFLHVPPAALVRDTTFWFLMSNSIIVIIAADSGMLFFRSSSDDGGAGGGSGSGSSLSFVAVEPPPAAVIVKNVHALPSTGGSPVADTEVVAPLPAELAGQALVEREPAQQVRDLAAIAENEAAYALVLVREEEDGQAAGRRPESEAAIVPAADYAGARPRLTASQSLAREERTARRRRHRPSRSQSHALVPVQDKSVVEEDEQEKRRAAAEESEYYARLSDEELNRRVEEFIARFNREMRLQQENDQLITN